MRRFWIAGAIIALMGCDGSVTPQKEEAAFMAAQSVPKDYVLSKLETHDIVLLGETHRIHQQTALAGEIIRKSTPSQLSAFASEFYSVDQQEDVNQLVNADEWDSDLAMAIMRGGKTGITWAYADYLDLLHDIWAVNRERAAAGARPIHVVALQPGPGWRERLVPQGLTYESFFAQLISRELSSNGGPILGLMGAHHAFTRFYQADLVENGRVTQILDRMGNQLSRQFGDRVFNVYLHGPMHCHDDQSQNPRAIKSCHPLNGEIDCAGRTGGAGPVGFDISGSPFTQKSLEYTAYGISHPDLRLVDFYDGYAWLGAPDDLRGSEVIPLDELAPDEAALDEVRRNIVMFDIPAAISSREEIR